MLQKPIDDTGFAFPGGHAAFGESNGETLVREFKEEIGADISVGDLKWVGELFFPWGKKPCQQICLYYLVEILSDSTPLEGSFLAREQLEGRQSSLEFHWVPLERLQGMEVYPSNAAELITGLSGNVQHFIYRE